MFSHLHVRSSYTFLFGTSKVEDLLKKAKDIGFKALALTDKGGLYGAVKFTKLALNLGIKPVIGIEAPLDDGTILVLIVKNDEGYKNLVRLISTSKLKKGGIFFIEDILENSKGLICLTGGRDGKLWRIAQGVEKREILNFLLKLKDVFKDDLYIEIQNLGLEEDLKVLHELMEISKMLGIKVLGTNSVTFLEREDYRIHKILVDIQRIVHKRNVSPLPSCEFYLKSPEEMKDILPEQAIKCTEEVVDKIEFELKLFKIHPPRVFENDEKRLFEICFRNLAHKFRPLRLEILKRLWSELELIKSRGFSSYFLVVHDIVSYAKKKGIRCSIRGSAVSSLVSYLLFGGVDPIKHRLLFERFLNDGRFDPPDIDVDFDSERREEVLRYTIERFKEKAALISTFPTFKARSAVREIALAIGKNLKDLPSLTDCLPYYLSPKDVISALDELPELKESPLKKEKGILEVLPKFEELPRQLSTHLGGVIVSEKLLDLVPLELSPKGYPISQYEGKDIEILGLPKFDLLGLRMHTAISKTLSYLKERGVEIDLDRIPLNDRRTYELLSSAKTVGVFQVESPGQRQLIGRLRPKRFSDILAEISLFRPGPVQADMIRPFLRRKHKIEKVEYLHPTLISILKETYGVFIYQEQILKVVSKFTKKGLDWADSFRRSMTHDKSLLEMEKLKEEFIGLCIKEGYSKELADRAWKQISAFASYGFCKAHAAAFAYITFQSAYLKAHFPLEFYLGLLNSGNIGTYPERVIFNEARRYFPVYPPHVNSSMVEYTRENEGIRVGLCAIKGIGPKIAERIVREREERGPFESITDFVLRVKPTKRIKDTLWAIGAFEGLEIYGRKIA
jgi:DNA-directed DNA polymerase III PolC